MRARLRALGAAVAMGAGLLLGLVSPQVVSAATPTITARVAGGAGWIEVVGHNFPANDPVTVEFNPNWSDSLLQDYTFNTNGSGGFDTTFAVDVTASCQVGIIAYTDRATSNLVTLDTTGQGCTRATISVREVNPGYDDRFALQGFNFTPGTTSTFTFTDHMSGAVLASGTLNVCGPLNQPGNFPPPPAGQLSVSPGSCTGEMVLSNALCAEQPGRQIDVSASDDWTFYTTPTVSVFNQPSYSGRCP